MSALSKKTTRFKENRPTIYKLKKTLLQSSDPKLRAMAPHVAAGLRIVNYMFAAIEATETVKAPRGIRLDSVIVSNNPESELAREQMQCALWLMECVQQRIDDDKKTVR